MQTEDKKDVETGTSCCFGPLTHKRYNDRVITITQSKSLR